MKRKFTDKEYFKLVKNKYNLNYDETSYKSLSQNITIICDKHGVYQIKASIPLDKGRGCFKCCNKYKSNTNDFIIKANKIHNNNYNYEKVNYINKSTKIIIICKNNHEFLQSPNVHLRGNGCKKCNIYKIDTKSFIEKANIVYKNKFTYNDLKYVDNKTKITVTCITHGNFDVLPRSFLYQNKNCPQCNVYNNVKLTNDQYIEKANFIHKNKYTYEKVIYKNKDSKVEITCKDHGSFFKLASSHLKGYGCPNCLNYVIPYTSKQYFDLAKLKHNNKYTYDETSFKNTYNKIIAFCKKHGEFKQVASKHLHQDCPRCKSNISKKETIWLDSLSIPISFRNFKLKVGDTYKNVDAYIPVINTVYEFHGDFWHGNPNVFDGDKLNPLTNKTFGDMYKQSCLKDQSIINFGYKLIIMWESEFDKIKKES